MGWLILIAIIGYPIYAYFEHKAGTAEPYTYIILGMCVMLWINIISHFIMKGGEDDR